MTHPQNFDPADPMLERVRALALARPGADMKVSHGWPAFFTQKVFAYLGFSRKNDDGDWEKRPRALVIRPEPDDRLALLDELGDGAWVPPYLGSAGWIAIELDRLDDDRIDELLDMSYRVTAPARLVRELDD